MTIFCVNFTEWQYNTFISINESAPIINLSLFSIVAGDNRKLMQIIES